MRGVFSSPGTFRKVLGPSTTLPLLAVILVVISVIYIPAAHAAGDSYVVVLDPNGGSWASEETGSFTVSVGENKVLPPFEGTAPEGTVFAGWSYADQKTQTLDFKDGSTFTMTSELAEKASGNRLTLYAIWIPKLTSIPQGEITVSSVCLTGDKVTVDLSLPEDMTVGAYGLAAGSVPCSVPAEYNGFRFSVGSGICAVDSILLSGAGNIRIVIPAMYQAGDSSDPSYVLVEWTLDLTLIVTLNSHEVIN